jgi:hypothetical protein
MWDFHTFEGTEHVGLTILLEVEAGAAWHSAVWLSIDGKCCMGGARGQTDNEEPWSQLLTPEPGDIGALHLHYTSAGFV